MTDKQPEALRLADDRPGSVNDDLYQWAIDAEDELRRLHAENEALRDGKAFHEGACSAALMENRALRQANEAFAKRQEWWNERMFALEKQRDELLEALRGYVNDYSSKDGMYTEKHYVKVFSEAIARAEGKQ